MNKFAAAVALVAGLAFQTSYAGLTSTYPVSVSQYGANGPVKGARNSNNNKEFIGCAVMGNTYASSTTYVACSAQDAAGKAFYCSKYNPAYQLIQAALAVSESSSMIINSDGAGTCTYIYVANYSLFL